MDTTANAKWKANEAKDNGEDSSSETDEEDELQKDDNSNNNCKSNLLFLVLALVVTVVFYFGLYLIMSHAKTLDSEEDADADIVRPTFDNRGDNTTCGADSFMLRDGVCDEATNTEICLYDGGDCCLEVKNTALCKNCSCNLVAEEEKLRQLFLEVEVKPFENPKRIDEAIERWAVEVVDVISGPVCAVLCLDHDRKADLINAWQYDKDLGVCRCGWIESTPCPQNLVISDLNLTQTLNLIPHTAFLQMKKTLRCDCLASDLLIESKRTVNNLKELSVEGEAAAMTYSAFHCQQKCQNDIDCELFSWLKPSEENSTEGECRLMESLGSTNDSESISPMTFQSGWVSSAKTCDIFLQHFSTYSNKDNTVRITCPLQANSNITGNEVFMVTVSSWANESFIEVFEWNDVGDLWKCTHTMTSYNKLLKDGTGGVLSSQSLENFTIVICGGQTLDDSNSDLASNNEGCITVSEQYSKASGSLFIPRIDAASLVIDNGNSLWVTGGYDGVSSLSASELIQPHDDPDPTLISFSEKQRLLYSRRGHCLVKIGPNVAILTGGVSNYFKREDKTLTVNISTMDWKEKVPLNIGRSNHACGVLIDLESQMKIAVTAGGTENGIMTNSVEILKAESEEQFHNSVRMWEFGPNLPDAMSDAASASTADQGTMFVIGGTTSNNDDGSTYVHMLQCADLQCQWTKLDRELIAPSSHGLAFLLPSIPMADRRLVGHQCGVFNETRDGDIIYVSTGYDGDEVTSHSEAFTTMLDEVTGFKACHDPGIEDAPFRTRHASGGVLNLLRHDDSADLMPTPVICGGIDQQFQQNRECYRLLDQDKQPLARITSARCGSASVSIRNGRVLWVTGGSSYDNVDMKDSTEWLEVDANKLNLTVTEGVRLPGKIMYHCLVMIRESLAFLYGGLNHFALQRPESWIIDLGTGSNHLTSYSWNEKASMTTARAAHSCGFVRDVSKNSQGTIVAAGGELQGEVITDDVELLRVYNDGDLSQWEPGPKLPTALGHAASTTTSDQTILIVSGGWTDKDVISESIFLFYCDDGICEWRRQCLELNVGRYYGVAFAVPPIANVQSRAQSMAAISGEECPASVGVDYLDLIYGTDTCESAIDGFCQGINNNADCNFDDGDCCLDQSQCRLCVGDDCICHSTGNSHCACSVNLLGDDICHGENNVEECAYDGGDCCSGKDESCWNCLETDCICHETATDFCTGTCKFGGDGWCDGINNIESCNYDDGDCCYEYTNCHFCDGTGCVCNSTGQSHCLGFECNPEEIGDDICHGSYNNQECAYDGGDCCSGTDEKCEHCVDYACICHETETIPCNSYQCFPQWSGDGECDGQNNVAECGYDGGDCCSGQDEDCTYCLENCVCHITGSSLCRGGACAFGGDGKCDGTGNTMACNYDQGDCCLEETYCRDCEGDDCICHTTGNSHCTCSTDLMGNDDCNGENNVEECDYDGGDCCSGSDELCWDCSFGSSCICHETGAEFCSGTCKFGGDGICDGDKNHYACNYDDGDCCLTLAICKPCNPDGECFPTCEGNQCLCEMTGQSQCSDTNECLYERIGNGVCEGFINNEECRYDGGDCCPEWKTKCENCDEDQCVCHETESDMCLADECSRDDFGDMNCDAENNVPECGYDGGDCCSAQYENCLHCDGLSCLCHETGTSFCIGTCTYGNDKECDGINNNLACNFDDGDCCLERTVCRTCEGDECICHSSGQSQCGCFDNLIGDDICDGENNFEECEYDGGDCCSGLDKDCYYCYGTNCVCHETGTNICHGTCHFGGDGICHGVANYEYCNFDDGDCCLEPSNCEKCVDNCICATTGYPHCAECNHEGIGDNVCHSMNNNEDCSFDGGDCCTGVDTHCEECLGATCICHETGTDSCSSEVKLVPDCPNPQWSGDAICDGQNNVAECAYDGGDCCLEPTNCEYCLGNDCICESTGESHCEMIISECHPQYNGDNSCDGQNNHAECEYDGGDCCSGLDLICQYCLPGVSCNCHETGTDFCAGTCPYGGDGWCHGPNNNEECNYDDGDCCLESANMCGYCEDNYDCLCHETGLLYCNNLVSCSEVSWVADGFCDDVTNIADCAYDGGDCCQPDAITDFCLLCECVETK